MGAATMRLEDYGDLPEDVQQMIAELQIKVMDLEGEAKLFRAAAFISFMLVAERIWSYF
ncbi:MAG TPA: hypothetical protein VE420_12080 [Gemmatimonadales bacterium]|nr:hypothetical protein [Gemmatimonadales bacterium]